MDVLVDTSIWVDYFKGGPKSADMDMLIDENLIVTNDLILAELIPYLKIKRQKKVIQLLEEVRQLPLVIDWQEITDWQLQCLRKGTNGIGIPDLLIAQNAKTHGAIVYSMDKHFQLLNKVINLNLYIC